MPSPVGPAQISATAPTVVRHPSGLVDRARAILARQAPTPATPTVAEAVAGQQRHSSEAIDDLRERAMALASDLGRLLDAPQAGGTLALPWRRPGIPAPAGGSTSLLLKFENLEDVPVSVSLFSSDLLGDAGRSIPARAISFTPAPVNIAAHQQAVVSVRVAVPSHAAPGAYSGLVQATGLPGVKAVITVEVS